MRRFEVKSRFHSISVVIGGLLMFACSEPDDGAAAFQDLGCQRCHGSGLAGTQLGPPLAGLSDRWNSAGLRAFLAHPDSFRSVDRRLSRLADAFPAPMPNFLMPDSLRSTLVTYLLSLEERP
jgi:mono/diheme cytochrome c family protein